MFTLLCFLISYLPFQLALNPASGIDLASGRVFILLFFLAWVFWGLKNRGLKIANNLITYFLLAFLFFAGLSCFWADNPDRALRKLAVFLSIFPLYFIVVGLVDSREKIEKVLKCIIWPAVVLALIGIGQFVMQFVVGIEPIMRFWSSKIAFIFWGRSFGAEVISNPSWLANVGGTTYLRAFSLFPDPHMFSFYLGMIIPIAIGIGIKNKQESVIPAKAGIQSSDSQMFGNSVIENSLEITKSSRILSIIIVLILIFAQILTFSRGGYVGFSLFLMFYFIVCFKKIYLYIKTKICHSRGDGNPVSKGIIVLFLILFLSIIFTNNPVKQRFTSIFDAKDGSNSGRIEIWKQSLEVSRDHLLTGVGIGNYSFYIEPRYGYRAPIYAHNTCLDILSEMGIFTLLVWVMMFASVILKKKDNYLFFSFIGSLIWFSGHAFFDTPIYSPRVLPFLIIILGLSSCLSCYRLD